MTRRTAIKFLLPLGVVFLLVGCSTSGVVTSNSDQSEEAAPTSPLNGPPSLPDDPWQDVTRVFLDPREPGRTCFETTTRVNLDSPLTAGDDYDISYPGESDYQLSSPVSMCYVNEDQLDEEHCYAGDKLIGILTWTPEQVWPPACTFADGAAGVAGAFVLNAGDAIPPELADESFAEAGHPDVVGTSTGATSQPSASCTEREARAAIRSSDAAPIFKELSVPDELVTVEVTCSDLTHDDVSDMLVVFSAGVAQRARTWIVFRGTQSGWVLALQRRSWASGVETDDGDVVEGVTVYREGDPGCCATGGATVRRFRWQDDHFEVVSVMDQGPDGKPYAPSFQAEQFKTPSENISCSGSWLSASEGDLICWVLSTSDDNGVPLQWRLSAAGSVANERATNGYAPEEVQLILEYGETWVGGPFACTSASEGLTCENFRTGHGFFLSRERQETF